jgi:ABC-type multidrug transport system fused ATPase/permease subunit
VVEKGRIRLHSTDKKQKSIIVRSILLLESRDRQKVGLVVIIQVLLGILDLAGVALLGVLGALTVSGVSSKTPGNRVSDVINSLGLSNLTFQNQVALLGAIAGTLLIGRTLLSIFFTKRILLFLSRRGAAISSELVERILKQPILEIQRFTTQETLYMVTNGVSAITVGVIGTTVALVSDLSLLLVMGTGLLALDPVIALSTFIVFGIIAFFLYRQLHIKALTLGTRDRELNIQTNQRMVEVLDSFREMFVYNRKDYYSQIISKFRFELAEVQSTLAFMPSIGKYVIEITVIAGALTLSAFQFILQDATHAIGTLAVFMAAGTRIAPAVLRIQQGAVQIRGSAGPAGQTLELFEDLRISGAPLNSNDKRAIDSNVQPFTGEIEVRDVSFSYPNSSTEVLKGINLRVNQGEFLAITGTSGAGKSTLVDLILGILTPKTGKIRISGLDPVDCLTSHPGKISYVPQQVSIIPGTISENIGMGFPTGHFSPDAIWEALRKAELLDFVSELPDKLGEQVGEGGAKLSGGQRQRLGIARALVSDPRLIILDEATSALDGDTEAAISETLSNLRGSVTLVVIAHRLSTIRSADRVLYLSESKAVATGTISEVRKLVPDFDRLASQMGLQ